MSMQTFSSILRSHPDMESYFRTLPESTQQSLMLANPHVTSLSGLIEMVSHMTDILN